MDTITSGIGGALITKAFFTDRAAPDPATATAGPAAERARRQARRVALAAGVLASVIPDVDVTFDWFTASEVAGLELHRGVTHSFVCLPLWAVGLAAVTRWLVRRAGWAAPSFRYLLGIYAALLAFHIWTDVITSYGTQVWAPLANTRVSWDLVFIIDFTFTGILLLPQVAAWAHRRAEGAVRRAAAMWVVCTLAAVGVQALAASYQVRIPTEALAAAGGILAAVFFLPLAAPAGARISRAAWCRLGVLALAGYMGVCFAAQQKALGRVERFAAEQNLMVEHLGALPHPPALTRWGGLVRTPDGVYQSRFHVLAEPQFRFFPDAAPNRYTEAARRLPEAQTYFWFARFPVVRYYHESDVHVVELSDLRFSRGDAQQPGAFTYRVTFDAAGNLLAQGWVED